MGTSLSEPQSESALESIARRIVAGAVGLSELSSWGRETVESLLDRLYAIIRGEKMAQSQEDLRRAIEVYRTIAQDHGFAPHSHTTRRGTVLEALRLRNARKYEASKILCQEVIDDAPDDGWEDILYEAHLALADAGVQQGAPADARLHYDAALRAAEVLDDDVAIGRIYLNSGALERSAGNPTLAREKSAIAFQRFLEADSSRLAGWALIQEASASLALGEIDEALESAERARNLFEVLHSSHGLGWTWSQIGLIQHIALRFDSARSAYAESLRIFVNQEMAELDTIELYIGLLEIDLANFDRAEEVLSELRERTSESASLAHLLVVEAGLVSLAALRGRWDEVRFHLDEAMTLAERTGYYDLLVPRQLDLAARARGCPADLRERLEAFVDAQNEGIREPS